MTAETPLREGETISYTRTFTRTDVSSFASLSNDEGTHHIESIEDGQVVVHGLLTATLPTKLGGDIDYIARTMEFELPRPAYTGVEITCETTYESVEDRDGNLALTGSFECETAEGDVVLRGQSEGIIGLWLVAGSRPDVMSPLTQPVGKRLQFVAFEGFFMPIRLPHDAHRPTHVHSTVTPCRGSRL